MTPEALLLNTLDDLEAKMQTLRNSFAAAEAQGKGCGELTDWVRSMDRALFNSRAFLDEGKSAAAEEPPAHPPTDASAATAEDLPATASTPLEDPESPPVD
jgi:3'-5' exoribonuclease